MQAKKAEYEVADSREILGAVSRVCLAGILSKGCVTNIVNFVLYSPMLANMGVDRLRGGALRTESGEDIGVFLDEPIAIGIELLTADKRDGVHVWKADTLGTGGPDRPPSDASVGVFFDDVPRGFLDTGEAAFEDRTVEFWLITLDIHHDVDSAGAQETRGRELRMGRIGGEDGPAPCISEFFHEVCHLGDLVRPVGDTDLPDDDTDAMDHGGEDRCLPVPTGPGPAEDLRVHGEHHVALAPPGRQLVQPGTSDEVQGVVVNLFQDIADGGQAGCEIRLGKVAVGGAEPGEHVLGDVRDVLGDLGVVHGAAERRHDDGGEHIVEGVHFPMGTAEIFHQVQHGEKVADVFPANMINCAGRGDVSLA